MPPTSELTKPENVRAWLESNHPKQLTLLDQFETELRMGRLSTSSTSAARGGSSTAAFIGRDSFLTQDRRLVTSRTVELLKSLIGSTRWKNAAQLLILLRGLGRELHAVGGFREPAIGNVVRRIMAAVREEAMRETAAANVDTNNNSMATPTSTDTTRLSLQSMLWAHPQHVKRTSATSTATSSQRHDSFSDADAAFLSSSAELPPGYYTMKPEFKANIMEAIQEIMADLEFLHKNINDQAPSHIHAGEIILTYGRSKTVELFLKAAASKKRTFQVVVCEGAPHFGGHDMAKSLAEAGIDTIVINDSATFALMARVNKVLLPAHAVLANGGLIASSGCNMVALAAKTNSVPVVSITGMFKLCPMFPHEGQDTLNDLVSPSSVMDYSEMSNELLKSVEFVNPVHDYIPPELISLYVTNAGSFQPSYIYRLLAEYYHSDDWESFE